MSIDRTTQDISERWNAKPSRQIHSFSQAKNDIQTLLDIIQKQKHDFTPTPSTYLTLCEQGKCDDAGPCILCEKMCCLYKLYDNDQICMDCEDRTGRYINRR